MAIATASLAALRPPGPLADVLLATLASFLVVCAWLAWRLPLDRLEVRRRLPRVATRGDALTIVHEVRHAGAGLLRNLEVSEEPATLGRTLFPALPPNVTLQAATRTYAARRGLLQLAALVVRAGDPCGLFEVTLRRPQVDDVVIRPRPRRVDGRLVLDEVERARLGREGADWESVRDWRPGDPVRRVHWPSTARRGFPVIRTAPPRQREAVRLALDLHVPSLRPADLRRFERAVALAAGVGLTALERGHALELTTLGDGGRWVGLRGRPGTATLLASLARVEPLGPEAVTPDATPGVILISLIAPTGQRGAGLVLDDQAPVRRRRPA